VIPHWVFFGKGKIIAWEAWKSTPELTEALINIATHLFVPVSDDSPMFSCLERFVVVMYCNTSNLDSVDNARMELFCHKNRTMENLYKSCTLPAFIEVGIPGKHMDYQ